MRRPMADLRPGDVDHAAYVRSQAECDRRVETGRSVDDGGHTLTQAVIERVDHVAQEVWLRSLARNWKVRVHPGVAVNLKER